MLIAFRAVMADVTAIGEMRFFLPLSNGWLERSGGATYSSSDDRISQAVSRFGGEDKYRLYRGRDSVTFDLSFIILCRAAPQPLMSMWRRICLNASTTFRIVEILIGPAGAMDDSILWPEMALR
jgi:hypothetical protein